MLASHIIFPRGNTSRFLICIGEFHRKARDIPPITLARFISHQFEPSCDLATRAEGEKHENISVDEPRGEEEIAKVRR